MAVLFSGMAFAQQLTDRHIDGIVQDSSGAVIVGAAVDLKRGPDVIAHRTTDSSGHFSFTAEGSQSYEVIVHQAGFKSADQQLRLPERQSMHLEITLAVDGSQFDVIVRANATEVSTQTDSNLNSTDIDDEMLNSLPIFDSDYIAAISQLLGQSMLGANGATIIINGVQANGTNGLPSAAAIKSVRFNNNPYSALYSRAGSGRIEITTKEGSEKFHGTLNSLLRNSVFDASNYFAATKPQQDREYLEGNLSGPVTGTKTTFVVSGSQAWLNNESIVDALTPSGPLNENVPTPDRATSFTARIFHDYGSGNDFSVGIAYNLHTRKNLWVGGLILPTAGLSERNDDETLSFQDTHVFSKRLLNQFRLNLTKSSDRLQDNSEAAKISVAGAFTANSAQADQLSTVNSIAGNDTVSYSIGKHVLKFGSDLPQIERYATDNYQNRLGTYYFGNLAAYASGTPDLLQLNRGAGRVAFWEVDAAGFIEDEWRVATRFSLTTGVRYYFQNYFHDRPNDIAPRLGFAWKPNKNHNTVIRGGGGIFYDRSGVNVIADMLEYNGANLRQYLIDSPNYPALPIVAGAPYSITQISPKASIPYSAQWSIGIEQQITKRAVFSAEYIAYRGIKLFRSLDLNAPLPPSFSFRPDPLLGQARTIDTDGRQIYNGLKLDFKGAITRRFTGQIHYELTKDYNNTSGVNFFPANSYRPDLDFSRADWDQRNRFWALGSFTLPYHFTLGESLIMMSGMPYTITTGIDNNNDGILNDRPFGTPRNSLHGPGLVLTDLRLNKSFKLSRRADDPKSVTLGLAAYNIINHPNFFPPIGVQGSPFFGRSVAANSARRMQASISYSF